MSRKSYMAAILLATLFGNIPAKSDTLRNVMAHALADNPTYRAGQANYAQSRASQYVAFGSLLPSVTAYASKTKNETTQENYITRSPEVESELTVERQGVVVDYTLFASGSNLNDFRAARAGIRRDYQQFVNLEQKLLLDVARVYLDVLRDTALRELNQKNLTVLEQRLRATRDRFEVGVATRTDVAQAEAAQAQAQAGLIAANSALAGTRARYHAVVGLMPHNLQPPVTMPKLPMNAEEALQLARRESPNLGYARENAAVGRFQYYKVLGSNLPRVTVQGRHEVAEDVRFVGNREEVTSITTQLTVPLFRGGGGIAGIRAGRNFSDALTQNLHAASRQLESDVAVTWANLQATIARADAVSKQITASEIALEGVQQEYQIGTRTLLHVLDAERALLNARTDFIGAERDKGVAHFGMLATIGRLTSKALAIEAKQLDPSKRVETPPPPSPPVALPQPAPPPPPPPSFPTPRPDAN